MEAIIDFWFWVMVKWGGIAFVLFYGKAILRAIGGEDGWDKKDVGATVLLGYSFYMIYMEGARTDLSHQVYSDIQFTIVVVSAILGFGIDKILNVISIIFGKGKTDEGADQGA